MIERDEVVSSSGKRTHCCTKLGFLAALITVLVGSQKATAGDLLFLMTNPNNEESVVIGEVFSIGQGQIIFEPRRVLIGRRLPRRVTITDYDPKQAKSLNDGDAAVLTMARINRKRGYKLAYTAFEVSSSEPAEADIITGPLSGGDRIAYNWFINSCGAERDFAFDYSGKIDRSFVRRDAELVVIAQRSEDRPDGRWAVIAEPPACEPIQTVSWWRQLVKQLMAAF